MGAGYEVSSHPTDSYSPVNVEAMGARAMDTIEREGNWEGETNVDG